MAITATFNEALDASTVNTSTVRLRSTTSGASVAASVTYDAATRVARLTPASALAAATSYTAALMGGASDPRIKDLAGNALASTIEWSFTTASAGDTTPPTVTTTSPLANATGVGRSANITATFNEAMTASTINTSTVQLRDPAGNVVPGVVTYSASNRRATLNPTPTLIARTVYTVTVKGGSADPRVKDAAGNALAADRIWTFTTK